MVIWKKLKELDWDDIDRRALGRFLLIMEGVFLSPFIFLGSVIYYTQQNRDYEDKEELE
jgi:hypothetical protein